MAKYGKKVQDKIAKNLHEHKHEGKFANREQAIAAAIETVRDEGGKVPPKPKDSN